MRLRVSAVAVVAGVALAGLLTGCSGGDSPQQSASLAVTGATVVRQENGDAYVTMTVTSSSEDRITSAAVDGTIADAVFLTAPTQLAGPTPTPGPAPVLEPGEPVDVVDLPADEAVQFGPGANGMWLRSAKELTADQTVTVTLTLADSGEVPVQASVR